MWASADSRHADSRPPGVYRQGSVLEVVHEDEEPGSALRARVREMTTPAALEIVCGPAVVPPPTSGAELAAADSGRRG